MRYILCCELFLPGCLHREHFGFARTPAHGVLPAGYWPPEVDGKLLPTIK